MSKIEEILGRDINSIKELREEIKRLQDSIAGVDPETEQFKTTVEQLTAAQEQLRSVTGKNAQENNAAKDSIVGMEQEYKNLYNTYKMLTEEQRNSGMGKNMAQDLAVLSDKINNAKKEVGNFKNNIGNYTGSIIDAFKKMGISVGGLAGPLKTATAGMGSLNAVMKANPVGLIVSAIMGLISLIKNLGNSVKNNEQLQMRWNEAMSAFQPIIDGVKRGLDTVGQVIVSVGEGIGKFVNWLREAGGAITDFLGITQGAQKRAKETNKLYKDLAKSQNELTKSKREYQVLNSKDEAEVERLREEISLTNDKAEKERLVNQAKEIQGQIDARNLEIAQEELRILEEKAKLAPNSAADNQAIANAQANVANATAQAARNQRTLNRLLGRGGAGSATIDEYKQKAKELYAELEKDSKDRITQLRDEYEEQKKLLEKYGYDTTLLTKKYNSDIRVIVKEEINKTQSDRLASLQQMVAFQNSLYELEVSNAVNAADKNEKIFKKADENYKGFQERAVLINKFILNATTNLANLQSDITNLEADYVKNGTAFSEEHLNAIRDVIKHYGLESFISIPAGATKEYVDAMLAYVKETIPEALDQLVKQTNAEFGTALQVPPELDQQNIANFQRAVELVALGLQKLKDTANDNKIEAAIRQRMDAIEVELVNGTKRIFKDANIERAFQEVILESIGAGDTSDMVEQSIVSMEWHLLEKESIVLEEMLNNDQVTADKKQEIWQKYYDIRLQMFDKQAALEELEAERTQQIWEAAFDGFDKFTGSIQTVTNAMSSLIQQEISEGKISEAQAKKKKKQLETLEKVSLAANIFQIAGSTANGIMGIWNAYALEKVANAQTAAATGPAAAATLAALNAKSLASAIINTAAMATAGAANIAAATMGTISKLQQFKEEGSAAVASTPNMAMIDSSVYSYSETQQNTPEQDELNRPIVVSVVDIDDALNARRVRVAESSF